jgi:hypothetical protein
MILKELPPRPPHRKGGGGGLPVKPIGTRTFNEDCYAEQPDSASLSACQLTFMTG